MKLSAKRLLLIDRFFWLPHHLAELFSKFFLLPLKRQTDHVFVIKFMGLGSIIRFASLCEQHQVDKSKITMVTFHHHKEICKLFGFRNTFFIRLSDPIDLLIDCTKLFSQIRQVSPSHIVDYERCSHAVSTLRFLLAWWGNCSSLSFEPNRSVQTKNISIYDANKITLEKLFLLGIDQMAKVKSYNSMQTVGVNHDKVLINVNASDFLSARRYPIKLFVETIKMLSSRNGNLEFYLTGASHEFDYVESAVSQLKGIPVYNKSGQWSLSELIDQLSTCYCFITCDSGPIHLSTYLGVPTIALWGPTQPQHFGYDGVNHLHSLSLQLECSPCFKHPTSVPAVACHGRIDCLNNLSPDLIVDKFSSLHAQSSEHRLINFPFERSLSQTSNMELV